MNTQSQTRATLSSTAYLLRHMLVTSHRTIAIATPLIERAEQVKYLAAMKGLSFPVLGAAPLFDGLKLVTSTTPAWALYNLSHDPLWQTGSFPIPAKHLRRLRRLYRAGAEFDALYVAHELPPDFRPEQEHLELSLVAPPPPVAATRLSQRLGRTTDGILALYAATLGKSIKVLALTGAAGLLLLRDPILMGTVIPPGINPEPGVPAVWFLLAAWRW